jgi:hypothetical protein
MKKFVVEVTPEQSTILQKLAFKKGCRWFSEGQNVSFITNKYLYVREELTYGNDSNVANKTRNQPLVSFDEAFEYLLNDVEPSAMTKQKPTLQVGAYEVIFSKNGAIKFGCTQISPEDVAKILELLSQVMTNPDKFVL